MALGLTPTLLEIKNEFGPNTKPAINSLRNFYSTAFGSVPAGARQSSFGGLGQPVIPDISLSASGVQNTELTFNFEITVFGAPVNDAVTAAIQYRVGSSGSFTTYQTIDYFTGGEKSMNVTGLQSSTTYNFRVVYYNAFNSHASDHKTTGNLGVTTDGLDSIFLVFASTSAAACSDWSDPNNYIKYWYTPAGDFQDADFLYTTDSQSNPAPAGYYSRGTEGSFAPADYYRQVTGSSGELIAGTNSC